MQLEELGCFNKSYSPYQETLFKRLQIRWPGKEANKHREDARLINSKMSIRYKTIIALLAKIGIRRNELISLDGMDNPRRLAKENSSIVNSSLHYPNLGAHSTVGDLKLRWGYKECKRVW